MPIPLYTSVSSSFEYTNPLAVTTSGPQRLEQRPLNTAWTVIIILVVLAFVVLTAALIGIFAQKYRKRRYRYYPAFKHRILEEDESTYSETNTIARFGKVYKIANFGKINTYTYRIRKSQVNVFSF